MTVKSKNFWFDRHYSQDGTREFAPCTAWVNFDGAATPIVIRDSLNVAGITDNGIADYTVNFDQAMDNLNYCFCPGSVGTVDVSSTQLTVSEIAPGGSNGVGFSARTLSSLRAVIKAGNGNYIDSDSISVAIFGGITL